MDTFTALLDACVLYRAPLRDVLLEMAVEEIFRARWTNQIHEEWITHLLARRKDLSPGQLHRTRQLMDSAVPNSLVSGYERLIDGLTLPDPNDRHVLAAAIVAGAGAIVTFNMKDFPQETLEPYGIEAQHPDDFLVYQFDLAPGQTCQAIQRLRARLKRPPRSTAEYLEILIRQELPQFVEKLRNFQNLL